MYQIKFPSTEQKKWQKKNMERKKNSKSHLSIIIISQYIYHRQRRIRKRNKNEKCDKSFTGFVRIMLNRGAKSAEQQNKWRTQTEILSCTNLF